MSPLTRPVPHLLPLAEDTPNLTDAGNTQIVLAVLLGIAAVVVAIDALGADLGLTLLFGLIVAVPTLVLCGPLLARFVEQWVPASAMTVARPEMALSRGRHRDPS